MSRHIIIGFAAAAMFTSAIAVSAEPQPPGSRVIHVPVQSQTGASIVYREVVEPAAVVGRELAEQPVHPHLIEVRIVNTTTFVDPERNYSFKEFAGRGTTRTGHTVLARVQQQHTGRSAQPARVVRPSTQPEPLEAPVAPTMIFLRPPSLPQPEPAPDAPVTPVRETRRLDRIASAGE